MQPVSRDVQCELSHVRVQFLGCGQSVAHRVLSERLTGRNYCAASTEKYLSRTIPPKSVVAECLSNMIIQLDGRRHLQVDQSRALLENRYRVGGAASEMQDGRPGG